jgi:Cys-tRNA(Pro) deacylase
MRSAGSCATRRCDAAPQGAPPAARRSRLPRALARWPAKKIAFQRDTRHRAAEARTSVAFTEHPYEYLEHGGAQHSAEVLGFDPFTVVKTLVMQDQDAKPLLVLMHGNRKVSTKNLARQIGAKSVEPCKPEVANRHSGYLVGGTSPFGTRRAMPVSTSKRPSSHCRSIADQRWAARLPGGHRAAGLRAAAGCKIGAVRDRGVITPLRRWQNGALA